MYQSMMCHPNNSSFFEPLQPQTPYFPSTVRESPRIGFDEQRYAPVYKSMKTESTSNRSHYFKGQSRDNSYDNFITDAQFSDDEDNNVNHSRSNPNCTYNPSHNIQYRPLPHHSQQRNQYSQRPPRSHEHQRSSQNQRPSDNRRDKNDRKSHTNRKQKQQEECCPDFLKNPHYDPDSIHKNESLKEIREIFERSLNKNEPVRKAQPSVLERVDSFPQPTTTRDDSKSNNNGSLLKALLSQVRLEQPKSIKDKYMRKLSQEKRLDLSTIVYK